VRAFIRRGGGGRTISWATRNTSAAGCGTRQNFDVTPRRVDVGPSRRLLLGESPRGRGLANRAAGRVGADVVRSCPRARSFLNLSVLHGTCQCANPSRGSTTRVSPYTAKPNANSHRATGFSSPRHPANCMLLIVISALSNMSTPTVISESGWIQARKSDSTSASTRTLTLVMQLPATAAKGKLRIEC